MGKGRSWKNTRNVVRAIVGVSYGTVARKCGAELGTLDGEELAKRITDEACDMVAVSKRKELIRLVRGYYPERREKKAVTRCIKKNGNLEGNVRVIFDDYARKFAEKIQKKEDVHGG